MVLRSCVPCKRITAPSTGLPASSVIRPLTVLVAEVGETPPIVQGEKPATPTSFTKWLPGLEVSIVVLAKLLPRSCCCQPVPGLAITYLYNRRLTVGPGPGLASELLPRSPTR